MLFSVSLVESCARDDPRRRNGYEDLIKVGFAHLASMAQPPDGAPEPPSIGTSGLGRFGVRECLAQFADVGHDGCMFDPCEHPGLGGIYKAAAAGEVCDDSHGRWAEGSD